MPAEFAVPANKNGSWHEVSGKRAPTSKVGTLNTFLQSSIKKRKTVGDDEYSSSEEGKWFEAENKAN
jgi:hypothetical protein